MFIINRKFYVVLKFIFYFAETGLVTIFNIYDGGWEGNPTQFVGVEAMGLMIPNDCTYEGLCNIICDSLNIDSCTHSIMLKYDTMPQSMLLCWTVFYNRIGLPIVVHGPIRNDPEFIRNKMLIV